MTEDSKSDRQGQKRMRGQPVFYEEKKLKRSVMLTDTSWNAIGNLAKAIGKSKSEWLELHVRAITGKSTGKSKK